MRGRDGSFERRGRNYSRARGLVEALLRRGYGAGWPARLWGRLPAAGRVRLVERRVAVRAPLATPLRVAFASDLHLGPTTARRTLEAAFGLLAVAAPDVLVLGGDYVFLEASAAVARELEGLVRAVPARVKVAVLGNHDLWTDHRRLEDALGRAGVRVLVNEALRLPTPHGGVAVVGLDDPWTGAPDPERAFAGARGAELTLAVCHAPEGLALVRGRAVALYLCGHTHGGHVALPGGVPIVVPGGRLSRRYPHGVHAVDGTTVFVSRGVGGIEVPFRCFAPPDVALLELVSDV
ncbi:MAG: metallophosphoesterase family protein [Myxococcales bacterium]|nr:metallophosphoesterase family protein [Myxococcales bacterium]